MDGLADGGLYCAVCHLRSLLYLSGQRYHNWRHLCQPVRLHRAVGFGVFFSVIGLHLVFNYMDWLGAFLILATMFLLSWKGKEQPAETEAERADL